MLSAERRWACRRTDADRKTCRVCSRGSTPRSRLLLKKAKQARQFAPEQRKADAHECAELPETKVTIWETRPQVGSRLGRTALLCCLPTKFVHIIIISADLQCQHNTSRALQPWLHIADACKGNEQLPATVHAHQHLADLPACTPWPPPRPLPCLNPGCTMMVHSRECLTRSMCAEACNMSVFQARNVRPCPPFSTDMLS